MGLQGQSPHGLCRVRVTAASVHHPSPKPGVLLGALQPSQASFTSQILLPEETSTSTFPSPSPALPALTRALPPSCREGGSCQRGCMTRAGYTLPTHDHVSQVCRGGLAAPATLTLAKWCEKCYSSKRQVIFTSLGGIYYIRINRSFVHFFLHPVCLSPRSSSLGHVHRLNMSSPCVQETRHPCGMRGHGEAGAQASRAWGVGRQLPTSAAWGEHEEAVNRWAGPHHVFLRKSRRRGMAGVSGAPSGEAHQLPPARVFPPWW